MDMVKHCPSRLQLLWCSFWGWQVFLLTGGSRGFHFLSQEAVSPFFLRASWSTRIGERVLLSS